MAYSLTFAQPPKRHAFRGINRHKVTPPKQRLWLPQLQELVFDFLDFVDLLLDLDPLGDLVADVV